MSNSKERAVLLRCQQGTSDKEYKLELIEDSITSYRVTAHWGKTGHLNSIQDKAIVSDYNTAAVVFAKILKEKLNKGYVNVSDSENTKPVSRRKKKESVVPTYTPGQVEEAKNKIHTILTKYLKD
jgi:predicted DNA-binding WGR domain protein